MSFPEDVKIRALVACGRCCCICHKNCGNNIEIHHIHPRAQGGEDTFENAIPLCFDCHAIVGQYNPKHPKGTKFSEKELIAHRDNWYNTIKENQNSNNKQEPIRIYITADSEPESLFFVSTGKELIAYARYASALDFDYDEPQTNEEQELFIRISEMLQNIIDDISFMDLSQSMYISFQLSDFIRQLDKMNYLVFTEKANRIIEGGITPQDYFSVWIVRILRKDNPNIVTNRSN